MIYVVYMSYCYTICDHIGGLMGNVFSSSAVDRGAPVG